MKKQLILGALLLGGLLWTPQLKAQQVIEATPETFKEAVTELRKAVKK